MSEIILNNIELGDTGAESRIKINNNSTALKNAIYNLETTTVNKTDISQTLRPTSTMVPSEKAILDALSEYPKKSEVLIGTILKGEKINEAAIKAITNPKVGDTYRSLNTQDYWTFDGVSWNNIGNIIPNDLAPKTNVDGNKVVYAPDGKIEIYQNLDDTKDKAISPLAVKIGLEGIRGLEYKESSTSVAFENLISEFNMVRGKFLDKDKVNTWNDVSYNEIYIPVKPNTRYLHSNRLGISILFYAQDKTFISQVGGSLGGQFKTPSNCYFVRYNSQNILAYNEAYIYEVDGVITADDKLSVMIGIEDISGAVKTDVEINTGSILPSNLSFGAKALDGNGNATISDWYHSDYVLVKPNTTYDTNLSNADPFIWFYDLGKRLISNIGTGVTGLPYGTFVTPVNAAYIRFNSRTTNMLPFYIRPSSGFAGNYYIPNLIVPKSNIVDLEPVIGDVLQTVPYASDGTLNTISSFLSYQNQSATRARYIDSVEINVANDNATVIVAFSGDASGNSRFWTKQFTNLSVGKAVLPIGRVQGIDEFLCFSGVYKFNSNRTNSVGGGITGSITMPDADLCIGINTASIGTNNISSLDYIALGDSITRGLGADTPYSKLLATRLGGSYFNYAVDGAVCRGSNGNVLLAQVDKVPANFTGLVTIMIGINDVSQGSPLGDLSTVLSKSFNDLDPNASFAEAFRLSLETIIRKAPNAIPIVILPLVAWSGKSVDIERYRQMQRGVCEYFAIPYTYTYKKCMITPINYSRLMPDNLHPNNSGHLEIIRVLYGEVQQLISYFKSE